ncbi:MAG TPA: hypothetical protein VK806_13060 [Bacteroidia bacterium]|jgi:hypothetical protein|nr:hypothetical protein [Bacteroidia bacterium]
MKRLISITLLLLVFTYNNVNAARVSAGLNGSMRFPTDSVKKDTSDDDDNNRLFVFGLEYASDQAEHGLHNTLKIPYIEPSFTYMAPKGFYIEVSDQFILAKKKSGFDAFCLNPGWSIDLTDYSTLNFNWTHYTFSKSSPNLIKSSLNNSLEAYITQWVGNFRGKFTVDYNIYKTDSTPNDIAITPDLMYKFKWELGKKSALRVKPEVSVDFGTENFYTQYRSALVADSAADGLKPKTKKLKTKSGSSSFGALDYNLELNIDLTIGKFDFEPAFVYTEPLYKPSNLPVSPIGYLTLSITYTISKK